MDQLNRIQASNSPNNNDYADFDVSRKLRAIAKKRKQNNWTLYQDETETFMFGQDLDLVIDELSTSWGI